MNQPIGGALASVLAQIPEIPYEQLGVFGMVAAAVFTLAVVLLVGMRTISPIITLLTSTFRAMQDSNTALLKRLEASDVVIDRNSAVISTVPIALEKSAAALATEVVTIRADVGKLCTTVSGQLDALKTHITDTGAANTETVIEAVKDAMSALEDIKRKTEEHNLADAERFTVTIARVNEIEAAILTALGKLAIPPQTIRQTTETATLTRKIETGRLPPVTELVKPDDTETKDPAA